MPKKDLFARFPKVPKLIALQALHACHLLRHAYHAGATNGNVEWDDLDAAHEQAVKALKMAKEI